MLPDPEAAGPAYAGIRTRLTELLTVAGPEVAATVVPACPDWTVKDVMAHLLGACEDIVGGNLDGVGTDPWTAAQVQRHAEDSLADLLEAWSVVAPSVESITGAFPASAAAQWVFDATTHEQDLRGALDAPGARDTDNVAIAAAFLADALGGVTRAEGLPTLALVLDGAEPLVLGPGDPAATLRASAFEVVRGFGGRWSLDQVRSLDWDGDPEPYFALFGTVLRPPAEPSAERT